MRIGIDLDNTIICYDEAFTAAAVERNLIAPRSLRKKTEVRNAILAVHGDASWQSLQGYVYGPGLARATIYAGVMEFLEQALQKKHELYIVSHKTRFGHFDESKTDLRNAARRFLYNRGITEFIPQSQIMFFASRAEKIACIRSLACDIFIDDLEEVLLDTTFPAWTRRVHFAIEGSATLGLQSYPSWENVRKAILEADITASE